MCSHISYWYKGEQYAAVHVRVCTGMYGYKLRVLMITTSATRRTTTVSVVEMTALAVTVAKVTSASTILSDAYRRRPQCIGTKWRQPDQPQWPLDSTYEGKSLVQGNPLQGEISYKGKPLYQGNPL